MSFLFGSWLEGLWYHENYDSLTREECLITAVFFFMVGACYMTYRTFEISSRDYLSKNCSILDEAVGREEGIQTIFERKPYPCTLPSDEIIVNDNVDYVAKDEKITLLNDEDNTNTDLETPLMDKKPGTSHQTSEELSSLLHDKPLSNTIPKAFSSSLSSLYQTPVNMKNSFQSASLYVCDLDPEVNEMLLFDYFNRVGPVASVKVTRRSLGYAYVNFHNFQDAERALDTMNFMDIKSKPCRIMWSQRDLHKSDVGNIFVKNLPTTFDNRDLYDIFSLFGNILSCKIATDENGVSKGYGYVHYETAEAAEDAISKLNGNLLEDAELHVSKFLKRQNRTNSVNWTILYVKHIPLSWTDADLRSTFEAFGNINSAKIAQDIDGKSKGFGWVDFAEHEAASKALEALNGKALEDVSGQVIIDPNNGAPYELYVSVAQKKSDRSRKGKNLYVKNIDETISDDQFRKEFAVFGVITSARIMRDEAGISKGFGFVGFINPEEATRAIAEMNGRMLAQKPLFVALHQRKEDRINYFTENYNYLTSRNGFESYMQQMPLDHNALALADPLIQKNIIGEILYPMVFGIQPELAGKITGLLLEIDNSELLHLMDAPEALASKIHETLQVLAFSLLLPLKNENSVY